MVFTSHPFVLQAGNFLHYMSRFVAGFVIGFIRVWQISLVTLSIVPLIALAGGIYAFVAVGLMASVRKSYVKAGEIAEEVNKKYAQLVKIIIIIIFCSSTCLILLADKNTGI